MVIVTNWGLAAKVIEILVAHYNDTWSKYIHVITQPVAASKNLEQTSLYVCQITDVTRTTRQAQWDTEPN